MDALLAKTTGQDTIWIIIYASLTHQPIWEEAEKSAQRLYLPVQTNTVKSGELSCK